MKGRFIAFEGCEGAGKSTQMRLLSEYLTSRGIPHILTREPGGGQISEAIRKIILDGKNSEMTDECEALLYAAARVQHLADTVEPALNEGKLVLCDRYIFSSYAYQGYGRGLDMEFLENINSYAVHHFMPDVTLFLNIPPRLAFERKHGADENDRIEQAGFQPFGNGGLETRGYASEGFPGHAESFGACGTGREVLAGDGKFFRGERAGKQVGNHFMEFVAIHGNCFFLFTTGFSTSRFRTGTSIRRW